MATKDPLTHIGAQNLAHTTADFFQEDITYIHYSKPIYHQLANDLAASIASRWKAGEEMDEGEVVIPPEDLAYLAAFSNSWGDVVFLINPKEAAPAGHTYEVLILDGSSIKRTLTASTAKTHADGRLYVDYPVELSIPDWGFPPTSLSWTLRVDGEIQGGLSGAPSLNNAAIVKKVVGIAGQSNALGHFTTLSGTGGRRDLVSAGALRRDLATRLGLRAVEVIPLEIAWGSAAAEKLADDDPATGTNHWWNLDDNIAGPRLVEALAKIASLGVPLSYLIWGQGENDASAVHNAQAGDPNGTGRTSSASRYKAATKAIFAAFRQAAGSSLPIYVQPIQRAFWSLNGADTDPAETLGSTYQTVRSVQRSLALEEADTRIGTWVPGAEVYSGYQPDTDGVQYQWIHYSASVYHAAALELSEAIASSINRISAAPPWTTASSPSGFSHQRLASQDIEITWDSVADVSWLVRNYDITTNEVISQTEVSVASWTFARTQQEAAYESLASAVWITVMPLVGGIRGPASDYVQMIPPDTSGTPSNLSASVDGMGDIHLTWSSSATSWRVVNYNVLDMSVLSDTVVTTRAWTFTSAQQTAAYGYPTSNLVVRVYNRVDGVDIAYTDFMGPVT